MSRSRRRGAGDPAGRKASRRWEAYLPYVAVVLFLAAALGTFDSALALHGDNAQFLILGRSLAEGHGLAHVNEPAPSPHTKYPFLFPLFLALIYSIAPGSVVAAKIGVTLVGAAAVFGAARLLPRIGSPWIAYPSVALIALNPHILESSHEVMSEIPYLCLTLWALDGFIRWEQGKGEKHLWGAVALAIASYFVRTVGITLIGAFLLILVVRKRFRSAVLVGAVFLLCAVPWAVRNSSIGGESYLRQFSLVNPYEPEGERITIGRFLGVRVKENVEKYGTREIARGLLPTLVPDQRNLPTHLRVLGAAVSLIVLLGVAGRLARRPGAMEAYAVVYLLVCLAWPEVWGGLRFLLPLLPFLAFYGLEGAHTLLQWGGGAAARAGVAAVAIFLLYSAAEADLVMANRPPEYPQPWANYMAVADWAKENTPAESVFCVRKPYLFFVTSERRTVVYLWSHDEDKVFEKLVADGVDYVVIAPISGTTARYLIPALEKYRDRFEMVLKVPEPDTFLLRMKKEGEA